jgi:hypothetical protein
MPTTPRPRRLTDKQARAIAEGAELVKADDWSDTHRWNVVTEDGTTLVIVSPSYGGGSRSGRDGWRYFLAALGPSGNRDKWATRQEAAAEGLRSWIRWATAPR